MADDEAPAAVQLRRHVAALRSADAQAVRAALRKLAAPAYVLPPAPETLQWTEDRHGTEDWRLWRADMNVAPSRRVVGCARAAASRAACITAA
jgi:hypothetical protein